MKNTSGLHNGRTEHRIIEIISVEPYDNEWVRQQNVEYVKASFTVDYNGVIKTETFFFTVEEWNDIKKRGFYLG